jgi:hypothetical protein
MPEMRLNPSMDANEESQIKREWKDFVKALEKHSVPASIQGKENQQLAIGTALRLPGQPLGVFWPQPGHRLDSAEEVSPIRLLTVDRTIEISQIFPCECPLAQLTHYHFESRVPF